MHRLDRAGTHPDRLNAIIFEEFAALRAARELEDQRILQFVEGLENHDLEKIWATAP